jgi:hypothetical protein
VPFWRTSPIPAKIGGAFSRRRLNQTQISPNSRKPLSLFGLIQNAIYTFSCGAVLVRKN